MTEGYGAITWWGFSPALDLQEKDTLAGLKALNISESSDCMNILLIGCGDCRHWLTTVARRHRHPAKKLKFYIIENNLELYARHLLFLGLALEPQQRIGLQDKTEMFLELFGNSLIRRQSSEYVERMSNMFIKMVTDEDYLKKKIPAVDFSLLKFKERDFLEGIYKFWRNTDKNLFDMPKIWDLRLRQNLGVRYDAIPNVFDWHYSMRLACNGADIIHTKEYSTWRHCGIAYEIREGTYDTPNRTLASGMILKHEGERYPRRGYWGDILVSPYIAFGIESEEKSFFKKSNNVYTKGAEHVSEFNITSLLYELSNKKKYSLPKEEPPAEKKTATLTEITEEDEEEDSEEEEKVANGDQTAPEDAEKNPMDLEYEPLPLDDVEIHFLPLGSASEIHKKSKYQGLFHLVYFGNSLVHHMTPDLSKTFCDKASIVVETAKFMVELRAEQTKQFVEKVTEFAKNTGCKVAAPCDGEKDAFAHFTFTRS